MALQLYKVTWYSKLIALLVLVVLPFVAFWLGVRYGMVVQRASEFVHSEGYHSH